MFLAIDQYKSDCKNNMTLNLTSTNKSTQRSKASTTSSKGSLGTLKQITQAFRAYQVARNEFINSLTGFLEIEDDDSATLEALMKNDVMAVLCCPLSQDPVAGIQSLTLQCLAKLSAADPLLSQVVVSCGILDGVLASMAHEHAPVQASASNVISAVTGSGPEFAKKVLKSGVMPALLNNLQSSNLLVKEAAVNTLATLIESSPEHAALVCTEHVLSVLVSLLRVQGSPRTLLLALVVCLSHVAAKSAALSEALVTKHGALKPLTAFVQGANTPPDIKAASLNASAQICRHNEELVNQVANAGVLTSAVQLLTDKMTSAVRRNSSGLLLQATQKTPDLAEVVARAGAPACLQTFMTLEAGNRDGMLAGCMIIGTMGSFKAVTAKALVDAGAGTPLITCVPHADQEVAGVAAWAIEQLGQHSEETAGPLVTAGALMALSQVYCSMPKKKTELRSKRKSSIKTLIRCAPNAQSLEPFVDKAIPPPLLKHFLRRLEPLLAKSPKDRQSFVTSGALHRLQTIMAVPGLLKEPAVSHAFSISSLFPEDVVKYYAGNS
ncbi:flagellar associated protein [Dunaliella salina]|uniref:Flagellar associated protein n=1 Tax=Dunaliella salina TaxID=3046 RepID=A0ABQ7GEE8_DUNSA|nr:flagellar associated protein [Dunaliella salina]|eukprot:KAF5832981.1 flagellar associated protein [Dunaliella salina]